MSESRLRDTGELGHELAREELEAFAHNEGLAELAALFGREELPEDTSERLTALADIADAHWDIRKGRERQAVDWDYEDDKLLGAGPDSKAWHIVFDAATKLGMVESSKPKNTRPDYLKILGGANKAPFDRLRYGLESVDDVGKAIVYMGSSRLVPDKERKNAEDYAPSAKTEFDLGCGAFEMWLGARVVGEVKEVRNGDVWAMRHYEYDVRDDADNVVGTKDAIVANTPIEIHVGGEGSKTRRATTYDNYSYFAERAELDKYPETSVVAVTTGHCVPSQHLRGVKELTVKYGVRLETIGHDAAYSGVTRKPSQLLQEAKAAISAARRLEASLLGTV